MNYRLISRVFFYIFGLLLLAFGTALSSRANLGVSPVSSIPLAGSIVTPLSLGMSIATFQILCVCLQLLSKRHTTVKLVFQLPMSYVFGWLTDFFLRFLTFPPPVIGYGVLLVASSAVFIALGVRIHYGVSLILMPCDALVRVISEVLDWPLSKGKFVFDVCLVAITVTLTLAVMGNAFAAAGIGTIISMLLIGPTVGLFQKIFPFFDTFSSGEGAA